MVMAFAPLYHPIGPTINYMTFARQTGEITRRIIIYNDGFNRFKYHTLGEVERIVVTEGLGVYRNIKAYLGCIFRVIAYPYATYHHVEFTETGHF